MSQRDLVAELGAVRIGAPPEVRERVRLIAAEAQVPRGRLTWRRAFVVAVPVAAALAAAALLAWPSHHENTATPFRAAKSAPAATARSAGAVAPRVLTVPPTRSRVQRYSATLGLRVKSASDVSDAVKRALRITASVGGHPTSVHAATGGPSASADLTLRVPRAKVATAIERLSALGTITDERVDVQDEQATLDATARKIARLQKQLAALRAQGAPAARIAALTARIEALQRGEAATRRSASFATVRLHVATRQAVVTPRHGHGRLHGIVVALTWLGVGALYALAVGLPVVLLLAAAWLAVRVLRRRREDALLSRS